MRRRAAIAIAGLDPSGGAGLAADLRAFECAGVWGAAACAALTVQSTRGLVAVRAVPAAFVEAQVEELFADLDVGAMKTGALGSKANVRAVLAIAKRHPNVPLVVDPVRLPSRSSTRARLDGAAPTSLLLELARAATLVTPNLPEAAALLGVAEVREADARDAAAAIVALGCKAVLLKGGHAKGRRVIDWLATPRGVQSIDGPRRKVPEVHGTGCVLASLIAGRLASRARRSKVDDAKLLAAARWARERLDHALVASVEVGRGQRVLGLLD